MLLNLTNLKIIRISLRRRPMDLKKRKEKRIYIVIERDTFFFLEVGTTTHGKIRYIQDTVLVIIFNR